jgi:hypothetical protein
VACQAISPSTKTGTAWVEPGLTDLCSESAGRHGRSARQHSCSRPVRTLERAATWTAAGSSMGPSVEPGADRPTPAGRLPG